MYVTGGMDWLDDGSVFTVAVPRFRSVGAAGIALLLPNFPGWLPGVFSPRWRAV